MHIARGMIAARPSFALQMCCRLCESVCTFQSLFRSSLNMKKKRTEESFLIVVALPQIFTVVMTHIHERSARTRALKVCNRDENALKTAAAEEQQTTEPSWNRILSVFTTNKIAHSQRTNACEANRYESKLNLGNG